MRHLVAALALSLGMPVLAAAPAAAPSTAQPAERPRVVCHAETETGSLLKKRRVCVSRRHHAPVGSSPRDPAAPAR